MGLFTSSWGPHEAEAAHPETGGPHALGTAGVALNWERYSITQTADLFVVDLRTAESVRNALKSKFGARNSVQLVRSALKCGMIKT
jgi:hypothetical protein